MFVYCAVSGSATDGADTVGLVGPWSLAARAQTTSATNQTAFTPVFTTLVRLQDDEYN
jgi:hypothetical protein